MDIEQGNSERGNGIALPDGVTLGDYRIIRTLGQGGFGITYLAEVVSTGEKVVIKENLPTFCAWRDCTNMCVQPTNLKDPLQEYSKLLTRFVEEAQLLSRLEHPGIVKVLNAFEALGTAYYVMPWIGGKELHLAAPAPGVIAQIWLRPVLRQILEALDYLHGQNIYHRDVKPANILLTEGGKPMLIDFGTAREIVSERSATLVGSPGYSPIEQITSRGHCGAWTDVYSLGATCYRLITGERPPDSNERLADDVDPLRPLVEHEELRGRFSLSFLSTIDKALALRGKDRWQSVGEWLTALKSNTRTTPADSRSNRPVAPVIEPSQAHVHHNSVPAQVAASMPNFRRNAVESDKDNNAVSEPVPAKRNRNLLLLSAVLGVAAVGVGGCWWLYEYAQAKAEERLLAQQEAERLAREKAELAAREAAERKAREEAERKAREEAERKAREEAERKAREEAERKAREERERLANEHYEKGLNYYKGTGGSPVNYNKAVEHLRKAVELGHVAAQNSLGFCYENGHGVDKDVDEAIRLYRLAAEQGVAKAQLNLGLSYEKGDGVARDESEAACWYLKAAEQGVAEAQAKIGYFYMSGKGVPCDKKEALRWFLKSAEQGLAASQLYVGIMYNTGDGVERNVEESIRWFRKAADQNFAPAQSALALCYYEGDGVAVDKQEAARWFLKAAEQGDSSAQFCVALLYEKGDGVSRDMKEAVRWYTKAAEQGNDKAQFNLAVCYYKGEGVKRDHKKAAQWFHQAAEKENVESMFALGILYENGYGVSRSRKEAINWYRKAAQKGNEDAKKSLIKMGVSW